jgi:hypothetical protein
MAPADAGGVDAAQMSARSPPEIGSLATRLVELPHRDPADAAQMSALSDLGDRLLAQAQMFSQRGLRARGRVTLRLRVTTETRRFYRWLERGFHRYCTVRMPFLRFLCRTLIETWRHALGSDVAYAHIYARDRYRCKSPVCSRHDLTPHHLRFRSAGGDDSDENLGGFCVWCHLQGIHEGRLIAEPPASAIRWHIGRRAHTVVDGRRRIRLSERRAKVLAA